MVVATLSTLAFGLLIFIARHLDKDVRWRVTGNARNLINDANGLVKAPANRGRAGKVIDAQLVASINVIGAIMCVNGLLETKILVVQSFHHDHGLAAMARRVGIALAQDIHDRDPATVLRVDLKTG